jgi:Anti-sigma factor NepR
MVEKRNKKAAKTKVDGKTMSPGQQSPNPRQRGQQPEWANGLRRLYDSVVEEPLPDSFADLIAKLDANDT